MASKNTKSPCIVFHLNYLNSVDHLTPIIWGILEKYPEYIVLAYGHNDIEFDFRVKFLKTFDSFHFKKKTIYDKTRRYFLFNSRLMSFLSSYEFLIPFHRFLMKYCIPNRLFNQFNISCLIYDWGCAGRINHFDGIYSEIPILSLPHGSSINKEMVFAIGTTINDSMREFIPQNIFDLHAVQTTNEMEKFEELGVDKSIISALGNQRFSLEWINMQSLFLPDYYPPFSSGGEVKCLFFLAGLNYGGDRLKLISLISELMRLQNIHLILCVRPDVIDDFGFDVNNFTSNNTVIDFETPPPCLIDWSDIVINFGSSIVFEAILKKKKVINLMFFGENQTCIFSGLGVAEEANSVEEVLSLISKEENWKLKIDESALNTFLDLINASVIDGVGKIEFACRKIISCSHNRVDYKRKLRMYRQLLTEVSKINGV